MARPDSAGGAYYIGMMCVIRTTIPTVSREMTDETKAPSFKDQILEIVFEALAGDEEFGEDVVNQLRELADSSSLSDYPKVVKAIRIAEES